MHFSEPLIPGTLLQRYKRFLADIRLDSGEMITATCANTGSMLGLKQPGQRVWLSASDKPERKYRHTWEMVEHDLGKGPTLVGINTSHPNRIVTEAIEAGRIKPLAGYPDLKREQKYGQNSRIDILLSDGQGRKCYVEIKNVHLSRAAGLAEFPDSITERGTKHLSELAAMVREGHRAVMIYLIQRQDVTRFTLARDIDPNYAAAFVAARGAGVEMLALRCRLSPQAITIDKPVAIKDLP